MSADTEDHPADVAAAPDVPILREPVEGVPQPLTTVAQLREAIEGLGAGHGPVAIDAERASGYRYSQRAYLVQLRRAGYRTVLIDPIALPDLSELSRAIASAEWVVHAANQDLPCLAEVGLVPTRLFDTELAGRLLGEERVALGTMVEQHLGVRLEKGHSASDWSTRPLPRDWLSYAALDVELLVELRNVLERLLREAGKLDWALEEFTAIQTAVPASPRLDPWRRTSGIHSLKNRRQLAAVRALWQARDSYAASRDIAPGRILPDAAIIDAARRNPASEQDLLALPVFSGSRQRRIVGRWFSALESARALRDDQLPTIAGPQPDLAPPSGRWRERAPEAAARLAATREAIGELALEARVLAQNLLASDVVRRLCWDPPVPLNEASVRARLEQLGARPWQIGLTLAAVTVALAAVPEPETPEPTQTPEPLATSGAPETPDAAPDAHPTTSEPAPPV